MRNATPTDLEKKRKALLSLVQKTSDTLCSVCVAMDDFEGKALYASWRKASVLMELLQDALNEADPGLAALVEEGLPLADMPTKGRG